jgi:hypothetical protein
MSACPRPNGTSVLKSFLTDASLLCAQAQECVFQLMEQARRHKRISPAQVHMLCQTVHTIKGTASMIAGGEVLVRSLHALENRLGSESISKSAERYDWLELARASLVETQSEIARLQRKEKFAPLIPVNEDSQAQWERGLAFQGGAAHAGPKGICAYVIYEGESRLYWFALEALSRVWQSEEIEKQEALCVRGRWVPVIGAVSAESSLGRFGFGLTSEVGQVVVVVQEVVAIDTWERASSCGALNGVEVFLNPLEISEAS